MEECGLRSEARKALFYVLFHLESKSVLSSLSLHLTLYKTADIAKVLLTPNERTSKNHGTISGI